MTIFHASRLSALGLIAALSGGAIAQAQVTPASPAPMTQRQWDPAAMKQRMAARHAERIKALHDVLGIRPDQETAFSAYAASMRQDQDGWRKRDGGDDARAALVSMTTPQRLDRMAQMMDDRATRMREAFHRRADAAKALYAMLGPDQKRAMDALPALREHDHGDGMGRRRHGMGPYGRG